VRERWCAPHSGETLARWRSAYESQGRVKWRRVVHHVVARSALGTQRLRGTRQRRHRVLNNRGPHTTNPQQGAQAERGVRRQHKMGVGSPARVGFEWVEATAVGARCKGGNNVWMGTTPGGGTPQPPSGGGALGDPRRGVGQAGGVQRPPPPHGEPLGGGWRQPDSDTRCRPWGRYRHPAEGALPRSTVRLMDWVCARVILCLSRWDRLRCGRQRTLVARAAGGSRTSRGRIQTGGRAARLAESVHPPDRLKTLESRARTVSRSVGRDSPPQNGAAWCHLVLSGAQEDETESAATPSSTTVKSQAPLVSYFIRPTTSLATAHHEKKRWETSRALLPATLSAPAQYLGRQSSSGSAPTGAARSTPWPTASWRSPLCLRKARSVPLTTRPQWPSVRVVATSPRAGPRGPPPSAAQSVLVSILPSPSFDALGIIRCTFLAPLFSCFSALHAFFDNRNGLREALLLSGELGAIVLRIQTGGAPDARQRGVEPSLTGPVRGCIILCTTGHHLWRFILEFSSYEAWRVCKMRHTPYALWRALSDGAPCDLHASLLVT